MKGKYRLYLVSAAAAGIFILSGLLSAGLVEEDLKPGSSGQKASSSSFEDELIKVMGGDVPDGRSVAELLGPLPSDTVFRRLDSLSPSRFATIYELADRSKKRVMRDLCRARLRELSRREVVSKSGVAALLGKEGAGLPGSEFFEIPAIPGESYRALLDYMEYSAKSAGGAGYSMDKESRKLLERSLRVSLAISTREGRAQYRDFDLVWAAVRREYVCAQEGERKQLGAGMLWLYRQLRRACGMEWLPPVSSELDKRISEEGGALFLSARKESAALPPSLAVITRWRCESKSSADR